MVDFINAATCLKLLKERDGISYSKSYFSQMVKDGKIPTHKKHNSPKDFYKYHEVLKAIEDAKDPTRDSQRQTHKQKREERQESSTLFDAAGTYSSIADMSPEEKKVYEEKQEAASKLLQEAEETKKEILTSMGQDDNFQSSMPAGVSQNEAKTIKEYWLGVQAEINAKKLQGELISVDEVQRQAFEMARSIRDTFLAIPPRLAPMLAADNDAFSIQNKLMIEINNALEDISDE
jgi:hypothetical protein